MIRPLRKPTAREVDDLQDQLNQLAIAHPSFVRAVAILVNDTFGHHLAAGTVVPLSQARRIAPKGGR